MTRLTWITIIGDLLALLLFAFIGQSTHETVGSAPLQAVLDLLITAAPFAGVWLIVLLLTGAWRFAGTWPSHMAQLAMAWLLAAPYAIAVRAIIRETYTIPIVFLITTFVFAFLMLAAWRTLAWVVWGRHEAA